MAITLPRRSDARKGRQPTAPDGSKAHEAAESKEMEQEEETSGSPEGEEGSESYRNGSKKDYRGRPKPSRQRSAKGAGNTKAPMDSDCGCGSKKGGCSCKGKKDGGMSRGPGELYAPSTAPVRQKNARDASCGMRRGDSLSVHEYLRACDLGIQNERTSYIRARLDATERLDLKCGKGAIRQGQKCTKGAATPVENALKVGGLVGGVASLGYGIYAASKGNYKQAHQSFTAGHGFTALSSSGMAIQGRRTKNKNMQRQGELGLAVNAALAGSNLAAAKLNDSIWAEGFQP